MRWLCVRERRGVARSPWRRRVTVSGHPIAPSRPRMIRRESGWLTAPSRPRMIRREFGWPTAPSRLRMIRREPGWFSAHLNPIVLEGSADSFVLSRENPR